MGETGRMGAETRLGMRLTTEETDDRRPTTDDR
jgi:hypothetical protein